MFSGFIREIDGMGRIVIPMQLRKELGIVERGSSVEMFSDGKQILLRKVIPACIFCDSEDSLIDFDGKFICKTCQDKIKSAE